MIKYIIENSKKYDIIKEPFEHLYIENFLPDNFYLKLMESVNKLNWWFDDNKKKRSEWNRYTICCHYQIDYLSNDIIKEYNKLFLNETLQKYFLDRFSYKKSNKLPKHVHIQLDSLKNGMKHALHCDKEPKYLTFVVYLAEDSKYLNLGTKIYDSNKNYIKTTQYKPNSVLIFAPSNNNILKTWHNMEMDLPNYERKAIQTWFLYDNYGKPPIPYEGFKWRKDERHLKERRKRYKLFADFLSKITK